MPINWGRKQLIHILLFVRSERKKQRMFLAIKTPWTCMNLNWSKWIILLDPLNFGQDIITRIGDSRTKTQWGSVCSIWRRFPIAQGMQEDRANLQKHTWQQQEMDFTQKWLDTPKTSPWQKDNGRGHHRSVKAWLQVKAEQEPIPHQLPKQELGAGVWK